MTDGSASSSASASCERRPTSEEQGPVLHSVNSMMRQIPMTCIQEKQVPYHANAPIPEEADEDDARYPRSRYHKCNIGIHFGQNLNIVVNVPINSVPCWCLLKHHQSRIAQHPFELRCNLTHFGMRLPACGNATNMWL